MSTEDDHIPPPADPADAGVETAVETVAPQGDPEPPEEPEAVVAAAEPETPAAEPETAEPAVEDGPGSAPVPESVLPTGDATGHASGEENVEDAEDSGLPAIEDDEALEAALEALLLVVDSPAAEESLAETLEQPVARVTVALSTMAQKFTERASGIDLRRVGEGWRFYTRDTYAPFVEKLLLDGQRSKLTRAALESLAVIAYRQPVTRARVAAVRGVNVDGVIRTLLARGLIEEMGTDPETTGTLYVTTELFLERLGLSSLNDLPPIAPLLPEVDSIDDI
ncbi:SMC-Scp complex subunit ScpB [Amycolatopsis jiangsuensis]|uniref:Segregation and condensation protein B n=1 Tax=Amycolatopsis jiangsuensis TaxID=1181879 RepID=A0A840IPR3_9PSEU|nr:SMC-Scp complex subunit ScpB [Amycolatopsis jiangsuensis]MBB4683034.1 segregation and condensation protein B [Amycolatopsis jiangsuensis]